MHTLQLVEEDTLCSIGTVKYTVHTCVHMGNKKLTEGSSYNMQCAYLYLIQK